MEGLKIHEIKQPFVIPDYKSDEDVKDTKYIISMLSVDKIVLNVHNQSGKKLKISTVANIFSGDIRYSKDVQAAVLANNVFLGYILTKPSKRDFSRQPAKTILDKTTKRTIDLGIFMPENKTNDKNLAWLPFSLKNKFEEAFQQIPDFHIVDKKKR